MTSVLVNEEAILRVGEVCEVSGRTVSVLVDKNKNLSDLFFHGKVLKNVSVGSFIEIKKGFMSLIAKVETEKIVEEKTLSGSGSDSLRYRRYLTANLSGYIDRYGKFTGGTRELPLIGNEAFILTEETLQLIHSITDPGKGGLQFSRTDLEDIDITLPVSGLLNSHIAIFDNTGSGNSLLFTSTAIKHWVSYLARILNNRHALCCLILMVNTAGRTASRVTKLYITLTHIAMTAIVYRCLRVCYLNTKFSPY
ncbi:hypothetical protein [Xenorhabdus bovienii]|uniref:Uncharacterized protein n=1 Tax=Xenorhabdus bovienii str. kraussei Becker Underwood TaxID=1398204 RepID=A0A077PSJ0_XENBV|nr:hypothetical protein [Xenorhabdus bovienii]CDH23552.1 hypothetical protein XBKB1_1850006 [Xenorhabdus bovienii str. kraussei Becker Underwood]